jgi:hypothetical protein
MLLENLGLGIGEEAVVISYFILRHCSAKRVAKVSSFFNGKYRGRHLSFILVVVAILVVTLFFTPSYLLLMWLSLA